MYKSTRGEERYYSFSEAVLKGIARDGGLFVPEKLPVVSYKELNNLVNKSYQDTALFLFNKFETDFSRSEFKGIIGKAYGKNFDSPEIAPLRHLKDNIYILELWHGPTATFKDMALQLVPYVIRYAHEKENIQRQKRRLEKTIRLILTATSGDTGSAALCGFRNKDNIRTMVLYPSEGISSIQELQMLSYASKTGKALAISGNFDDAQRIVKDILSNDSFKIKLEEKYYCIFSSANSINWGRVMAQTAYYFSAYLNLIRSKAVKMGDRIDFAVPSGNFGNILALYYAHEMGLPVRYLICASNENNVLTQFINTGVYDIRDRKLVHTPSPSMDILVSGNIERLIYHVSKSPSLVSEYMKSLKINRYFRTDGKLRGKLTDIFKAGFSSNDECLDTIKRTFADRGYLADPHTSVAINVCEKIRPFNDETPVIVVSTAHFAKFPRDVCFALDGKIFENDFEAVDFLSKKKGTGSIPKNILSLRKCQAKGNPVNAEKETVMKEICRFLEGRS